jgi:uncharacterized protein YrzB (UPF0473 family)
MKEEIVKEKRDIAQLDDQMKGESKMTDKNKLTENEPDVKTVIDEEGEECKFWCIGTLEVSGNTYYVLVPLLEEEVCKVKLVKLVGKDENGEEILEELESKEEWEKVADAWEK